MQKGRMEMKKKWAAIAALSLLLAFGGTTACGYSGRSGKYDYCTDIERRSAIETDK
jgi:hypothetical protein